MTQVPVEDCVVSALRTLIVPMRTRPPVTLGGLTHATEEQKPRKRAPGFVVYKDPGSAAELSLPLGEIWGDANVFSIAVLRTATISNIGLAFMARNIDVEQEDFTDGLLLSQAIGKSSQSLNRRHKLRKRTVGAETDFMVVPQNSEDSEYFKTGSTIFQNLLYLLYLFDTCGWSFVNGRDMVTISCHGTLSQTPGRAFVLSLLPPMSKATRGKLVICHARFGDRLQGVLRLETVPKAHH